MSGRNSKFNSGFNGPFGCPTCDGDTSGLTELTTGLSFPLINIMTNISLLTMIKIIKEES
ncbi:MAG: hypothetical protein HFI08_02250 [Bacilli bacterium]|jgi:hypothetical protein|nr:hypothetical protein [Bacilli bacterium]